MSLVFSVIILTEFTIQSNMESTRIGHIYLGSEESSYSSTLSAEIDDYLDRVEYRIYYQNQVYDLDIDMFQLDIALTLSSLVHNQNNQAKFNLSSSNQSLFENDIKVIFSESVYNEINIDVLIEAIKTKLASLTYFYNFDLSNYFEEDSYNQVLVSKNYQINDIDIISDMNTLESFTISGKSQFSLLSNDISNNLSNESLSFIASCLLNISLESHFNNFSYNKYEEYPAWADYAFNVRVLKNNNFDFSFYNDYDNSYTIVFTMLDSTTVKVELLGLPYVNEYSYEEEIISVEFNTIYIPDSSLVDVAYKVSETDEEIIYQQELSPGVNGEVHQFKRTILTPEGEQSTIILISDLLEPTSRVVAENIVPKVGG